LLDEARRRLGAAAQQVRWVDSRVEDLPGEASYGAAIAVLVLQELPDDGAKLAFLSALARLLQPGAPLVLVDVLAGFGGMASGTTQQFQAALKRFQGDANAQAVTPATPLHLIGEARRSALLAAAGFSDPLRFYQALQVEGVVVQKRP
jgi:tRNA (cmo5U34)-methyltransferase